ncbi:MAG: hypothetical protein ACI9B2_000266, partial [Flavobacteriales bacterium]
PVVEKVNLIIPIEHINGILTIYNIAGQKMYQNSILNSITQIDVSGYTKGSYYIKYTNDRVILYNKIIKIDH